MNNTEYKKLKDATANLRREYEVLQFIQGGGLRNHPEARKYDLEQTANNSVVKCFDLCYEMLWQHLQKHLEEVELIPNVPNSPKGVFRAAQESHVIAYDTTERFFKYNKIRNNNACNYGQEKSGDVLSEIENLIDDATTLYEIMAETE